MKITGLEKNIEDKNLKYLKKITKIQLKYLYQPPEGEFCGKIENVSHIEMSGLVGRLLFNFRNLFATI